MARKESELALIEAKLRQSNLDLMESNKKIYINNRKDTINDLVFIAPFCAGLMEPPKSDQPLSSIDKDMIRIDASSCFTEHVYKSNAKSILTAEDYKILIKTVDQISTNLIVAQDRTVQNIITLPARAEKDTRILHYGGSGDQQVEKNLRFTPTEIHQLALHRTAIGIKSDFMEFVTNEIRKLREIDWP